MSKMMVFVNMFVVFVLLMPLRVYLLALFSCRVYTPVLESTVEYGWLAGWLNFEIILYCLNNY